MKRNFGAGEESLSIEKVDDINIVESKPLSLSNTLGAPMNAKIYTRPVPYPLNKICAVRHSNIEKTPQRLTMNRTLAKTDNGKQDVL